jgi:hypothetical protein
VRRLLPVIIIAALALTLVPLALAGGQGGGGWKHGKAKFNLVGTITAVDAAEGTVTIKVKSGTKTVRVFRGKEPTMNVAAAAKIRLLAEDEAVAIPLADVPVGGKVKARGIIDRTDPAAPVFTVRDLKVKAPPAPAE